MAVLEIIKLICRRTGFFKIYELCDKVELLELENKK